MSAGDFSESLVKQPDEARSINSPEEPGETELEGAMACQSEVVPSGALSKASGDSQMLNQLMQRMKSDLMFELRNLQHGERPVTGQGHRDNLHQFMLKHREAGSREGNSPANVDAVEHHRPESVVVEVQGVIERRPVSSILQSAAFRRRLENAIRDGISSASSRTRLNVRPSPRQQASTTPGRDSPDSVRPLPRQQSLTRPGRDSPNRASTPQPSQVTLPLPAARTEGVPTLLRSDSTNSIDSFSSAVSEQDLADLEDGEAVVTAQDANNHADLNELPNLPRPLPRSVFAAVPAANLEPNGQAQESLQNPLADNINDVGRRSSLMHMGDIHREEFVQEISELLHSRLVSSTLGSEFRATLELHAQDRVLASGTDGRAVQDFVHSLPGTGIIRNDFSHLGIQANDDGHLGAFGFQNLSDENLSVLDGDADSISVRSMSVPYTQTNTYLGREIQGLKSQIASMKSMLKLTFDMQQEIQRCIRQEVAAAINAATVPTPAPSRPVSDGHCLICLDQPSNTVLYRCGHMCVCYKCGRDLVSRGHNCPVCRAPIHDVIRAYKTTSD